MLRPRPSARTDATMAAHSARFAMFCVNDLSILILSNGNFVKQLSDE